MQNAVITKLQLHVFFFVSQKVQSKQTFLELYLTEAHIVLLHCYLNSSRLHLDVKMAETAAIEFVLK